VSFAPLTLCVGSQLVFIVVSVYFVIDSVWKLLDTPSYFLYNESSIITNLHSINLYKIRHLKTFLGYQPCHNVMS
jgi:hypothetical protein